MNQDQLKQMVGEAARDEVLRLPAGQILGVGTGSTVNCFIDALASHQEHFAGTVSSSNATTERLLKHGFKVLDPNDVDSLPAYVDGADEIDPAGHMIKGGGGALTREKIIAAIADRFVCIVDRSKVVPVLGSFPLPVEIISMAGRQLMSAFGRLGAEARWRKGYFTDNGNPILDVHGLRIDDPVGLETELNQWPGVVTVGLFARRGADVALVADPQGIRTMTH
jgi:ribose 5-phosphate isomerase A